jgi:hypothetical protein
MNQNSSMIGMVLVLALIGGTISSCNNSNVGSSVNTNSSDYRYAKERVKLEGYSDKESAQAAEAIIKFQNAQRNKR